MTDTTGSEFDTFVFDSTHHAMWAEDLARERELSVEVIPAPPEAEAKCGLALRIGADKTEDLREAFDEKALPYTVLRGEESRDRESRSTRN